MYSRAGNVNFAKVGVLVAALIIRNLYYKQVRPNSYFFPARGTVCLNADYGRFTQIALWKQHSWREKLYVEEELKA